MIYATAEDFRRCYGIVKKELSQRNILVSDDKIKQITEDLMNISYAKGGDYSAKVIQGFAKGYFRTELYKEFLD